jgi:nucleoside-diphosphate-sugar epimerase
VLVTGIGGFIEHHLVKYLVDRGYRVRGVDLKHQEYEPSPAHEFELLDLPERELSSLRAEAIPESAASYRSGAVEQVPAR